MPQKGFSKPRTKNSVLGWGKIWILVVVTVIVVAGVLVLVWQRLQAPADETVNLPADLSAKDLASEEASATEGWKTYRRFSP